MRTTRRTLVGGALGVAAGSLSGCTDDAVGGHPIPVQVSGSPPGATQPNLLVVITDDQRWDHFSAAPGCPDYLTTPNIDRLAMAGARCDNAFVTTALCSPSRATFLTGKYATRHGVRNNLTAWDPAQTTVFEPLMTAGYDCAFIGKWHMPGGVPDLRGVSRFITFTAQGGQGQYVDCPLLIDGVMTPRPGTYITEDLTDFALDWLAQRPQDQPWCLYLAHKAVHHQFEPPAHLKGTMDNIDLSGLPPEAYAFMTTLDRNVWEGTVTGLQREYRRYLETLLGLDEQIGRLLDNIDLSNTYVIFTSDNGYSWGEHVITGKRWAYEENTRVPMIVAGPGISPSHPSQLLLNADVAPTLLEWAGAGALPEAQGRSFAGLLAQESSQWRQDFVYEYFVDFPYNVPAMQALRTDQWLWIEFDSDDDPQLYDIGDDPHTRHELRSSQPQEARVLAARLAELGAVIRSGGQV